MSSTLLHLLKRAERSTRRLAQAGNHDGTGARYPRDYYRAADRGGRS